MKECALFFFVLINTFYYIASLEGLNDLESLYKTHIKSFGYQMEEHEVITEDGYILSLWHLVPNVLEPKKVVYIQHGFTCTSWAFFHLGNNSLPFLLIEEGYDVWLGNTRGTIFSLGHVSKDSNKKNGDYWDFSMDEMIYYDVPTLIDYVKKFTSVSKVDFIGHSQGTTMFFMLYRHNPSYIESSINTFISLGTVPSITYVNFLPIKFIDLAYKAIKMSRPLTKAIQFSKIERFVLSSFCRNIPSVCQVIFEAFCSPHPTNRVDYSKIYPFLYYYPGGCNTDSLLHWSQMHREKDLVYFNPDYDKTKESKAYDINPIKKWKIKSLIQRSDADSFSTYEDVTNFYDTVEDKSYLLMLDTPNYGHLDELAADSAYEDVYKPIIEFLKA